MISRAQFIGLGVLGAMGDGFNNPVVKNNGGLVIPSIHSPNFIHNVSGWSINKDGTAEFQNIIARGDIQASSFTGNNFRFTANGEFFYKAAPALGKLVLSITNDNYVGDDGLGNTVVGGVTSYVDNGTSFDAVNFQGGQVNFFNSPTANGAYTLLSSMGTVNGNGLEIITQTASADITIGPAASGIVFIPTNLLVQAAISASSLLEIANLQSAPGQPSLRVTSASAGDRAFALRVAGDTNSRYKIDSGGSIGWGIGSSFADTVMYRSSPGVLASDFLVNNQGGSAETWHSLGALGAHYTVTRGLYRFSNEGMLFLDIKVSGDGLQATSVTFANTLPAIYRPTNTHDVLPMGTTRQVTASDIWPRLSVTAAGAVTVINQGTANDFAFCGAIPLDT